MPWEIKFEVTDKYLSDALASVHRLRGKSNMGIHPVYQGSPSEKEAEKITGDPIVKFVTNSKVRVNAKTVAEALNLSPKIVGTRLWYLAKTKQIKRVAPGQYTGVKKHG